MLAFTSAMSLAAAAAEQDGLYKADSPVTSLSSGVPAHNSSDQPFMLVEFYSAWCGHCQQFAPTYEELARVAKQRLPTLTVGAVNCPSHEDACGEHKVSSFPTILLFPGNHRYASHNRSVEGILAWVANQRTMQQLAAHAPATHGHLPVLGTEATRRLALDSLQGEAAAAAAAAALSAARRWARRRQRRWARRRRRRAVSCLTRAAGEARSGARCQMRRKARAAYRT